MEVQPSRNARSTFFGRPAARFVEALRSDEATPLAGDWRVQLVGAAAILGALALWLALLGRPLVCACGTVTLWVDDVRSPEASQQVADWYSLLHLVFGFGLWLFLDWMKPGWPTGQKLLVALASSAIWEGVENLPFVIAIFGNAEGAPPYGGDTILNALADTVFVAVGFLLARQLPVPVVLALAVALEVFVLWIAGDGYVLGSLRLLGISV